MQTANIKPRPAYRNDKAAYVMILPAYLIFTVFILLPIGLVAYYSFTNYNMFNIPRLIGLQNYERLFKDGDFLIACVNTLVYTIFTLGFQLGIGLFLAVVLFRKSKWIPFFRISIYLPHVMSMVCVSMVWLWIFDPTFGMLNGVLKSLGLQTKMWLMDPSMSMVSVIIMSIWKSCGYAMVVFLSGLTGIPASLYEAAKLDGAGVFSQFKNVTWPMLKPTTFFLLVTGLVNSFSVFEQVNILTNGGPLKTTTTIVHQIYRRGFLDYRMGYASSMAILLLAFSLIVTISVFKFGNKGQDIEIF